jgi:hypothetical protein
MKIPGTRRSHSLSRISCRALWKELHLVLSDSMLAYKILEAEEKIYLAKNSEVSNMQLVGPGQSRQWGAIDKQTSI